MSRPHTPGHTPCHKCTPRHTPCHSARQVTRRVTVPHLRACPPCRVHHIAPHLPLAGHTSCQHARSTPRRVTRRVMVPHLRGTPAPRHNACHVTASHTRSRSPSQMHTRSHAASRPHSPVVLPAVNAHRVAPPCRSTRGLTHLSHPGSHPTSRTSTSFPHLLHARSRSLSQMRAGSRPMSRSCTPALPRPAAIPKLHAVRCSL